ncbi:hypothetical protein CJ030_MR8G027695 [Morella rubra]|uniref:Uncharacterized protein n=1 Tax=Morella rubra TaxID=262757 RepID=A0A6A1UXN9_9ROSI|nr:hypothetical protein CJ030_MR8G027695 [Morella rubra]
MSTGWRRAFCNTIPRDPDSSSISEKQQVSPTSSPSPRRCTRLGFFSGGSNPSTPRLQSQAVISSPSLRCRTTSEAPQTHTVNESPRLGCIASSTPKTTSKSPRTLLASNQTSPRSPLKLSLFKNSFKFGSSCGICLNSVKTGQGTAIYTAECAHAFHFPCIAEHVRKHGCLVCPVCNITWKDVPLLAVHKNLGSQPPQQKDVAEQNNNDQNSDIKPKIHEKRMIESSPRSLKPKLEILQQQKQQQPNPSYDLKSYDDDEPLLSPTAGSRISPIPEADENAPEDDVDEEFQGFFVNPHPPSSSIKYSDKEAPTNGRDHPRNVRVKLLPESAQLSGGRSHETYVVALRVKAPPACNLASSRPLDRAPIDLVTVLDVGGSMTANKLQMLKRAMRLVISSLGSADRLSIVAFSTTPKRLLPLRRMTVQGQRVARRIVDRLVCGQGTSVGDALRKATKVLEDRRERNPVASMMLLSDGQDHEEPRVQRQESGHVSSSRFAHIEIPVHKFGFGEYGHEHAEEAFCKCVGGLLSVVVQDLRIQLEFPPPAEISAIYSCNERPTVHGSGSVRLGDLYAEEERELLVELRVPTAAAAVSHQSGSAEEYLRGLEAELAEVHWRRQQQQQQQMIQRRRGHERDTVAAMVDENGEPLTPSSAWRAAERLAKVAIMKKSLNRVSDLHGFENARF